MLMAWEEWGGLVETGAVSSGRTSGLTDTDSARYFVSASPSGGRDTASAGFSLGDLSPGAWLGTGLDILAGGPQKRERTAEAERDEARYLAEAARYQAEAAALAAAGGGGGLMAALAAPSPLGVSWGTVAAVGAGLVLVLVLVK